MKGLGSCLILSLLAACVGLPPRPGPDVQAGPGRGVHGAEIDASQARAGQDKGGEGKGSEATATWAPGTRPAGSDRAGKVGPDGAAPADSLAVSDRGIGGTGAPVSAAVEVETADRGIGGTGIVGVVTGFGSIFVDGIEVEYDASVPVDIDGDRSSLSALRAGQVVVIQADGPADAPHARTIAVRSAAMGRVEALEPGSRVLTIAGQAVTVPDGTWGANHFGLGDWVRVSGLRRPDGMIVASRLDAAPVGVLRARGQAVRDGAEVRVGNLVLSGEAAASVQDGQFVVVSGDYTGGRGTVRGVVADKLWSSPSAYFGTETERLTVQAFARVTKGWVLLDGMTVRSALSLPDEMAPDGIAVVSLQREPDGSYTAVDLRFADYHGRTLQPGPGGSGAGSAEAAPSRGKGRRAAVAALSLANDVGPVGPMATASIAIDAYPAGTSTSGEEAPTQFVTTPLVSPMMVVPVPVAPLLEATPPAIALPGAAGVSSAGPSASGGPSAGGGGSGAGGSGAGGSGAGGSNPVARPASGGSATDTGQLISSNTTGTTGPMAKGAGIASASAGAWHKARSGGIAGATSAPGVSLLTATVTSDTKTVTAPAGSNPIGAGAGQNVAKAASGGAVAGRTMPAIGTTAGKPAIGGRTN